jgi:hypothetical protein
MVAPLADRASQRPKTVTSQGVFQAEPPPVCAGDKIEGQWASGRCLSADRAGVYSR